MRVLVACEESGVVRDAFAARGHDAWSTPHPWEGDAAQANAERHRMVTGRWQLARIVCAGTVPRSQPRVRRRGVGGCGARSASATVPHHSHQESEKGREEMSDFKIGDRVNAIGCQEAGLPHVVNMEVVSAPWMLGHGEKVVRCKRVDGRPVTYAVKNLTSADWRHEVRPALKIGARP